MRAISVCIVLKALNYSYLQLILSPQIGKPNEWYPLVVEQIGLLSTQGNFQYIIGHHSFLML